MSYKSDGLNGCIPCGTATCLGCGARLLNCREQADPDENTEPHCAHGRCRACLGLARRDEEKPDRTRPAPVVPIDIVLEERQFLLDSGVPEEYIPARLGMSPSAYERAIFRARRRGDSRAA